MCQKKIITKWQLLELFQVAKTIHQLVPQRLWEGKVEIDRLTMLSALYSYKTQFKIVTNLFIDFICHLCLNGRLWVLQKAGFSPLISLTLKLFLNVMLY